MELFAKQFVYLEWDDILKGKKVVIGDTLGELKKKLQCELFDSVMENKGDYPFTKSEDDMNFAMAYYDPNYECKRAYAQGKIVQFRLRLPSSQWMDCPGEPEYRDNSEYRVKPKPEMWTACIDDKGVISSMPAREWNKSKGEQLIEGTREKCETFIIENYCGRCARRASCTHQWLVCNGQTLDTATKIYAWYCPGFRELNAVKKRCMTNRELAKWVAQGSGECMCDEIAMSCWRYVYNEADMPVKNDVQIRGWDETEWHEPIVEED